LYVSLNKRTLLSEGLYVSLNFNKDFLHWEFFKVRFIQDSVLFLVQF
jgi:hypothetical protein